MVPYDPHSDAAARRSECERTSAVIQRGRELLGRGKTTQAIEVLERGAACSPDEERVLEMLGIAYHEAGKMLPALKTYDRLIELGAATPAIWCRTGNALSDVGEYAQAIGAYEECLRRAGDHAEAHHQLGKALYQLGQIDRAAGELEACAQHCDQIDPWLSLAVLVPGCPEADHQRILDVRKACASRLREIEDTEDSNEKASGRRDGKGPLRVGYLSSFFDRANYMKPVWGLINHHDRSRVQVSLFSDTPLSRAMNGYEPQAGDRLVETGELSNAELREAIGDCRVDILVDLNAFSVPTRLPLFTQPVAPTTVAWFNMYATSALPAIDYLVGDDETVRPEEEQFYTERILRLPLSYLTFDVRHEVPPVVRPPCVRNGYLTFGSLVTQYKICPPVLDAWAEILRRAPSSRLLLGNGALKSPCNREFVTDQFAQRGVECDRISLLGPAEHYDFLGYYNQIDVALDAFPYNGGTTTMEAIWQGVPVLTFDGDRWASRTSQTLLRRSPLGNFVAPDVTGMVDEAVRLANDPSVSEDLSRIRRSMRQRLSGSRVCDTNGLARTMERIYESIAR